MPDVDGEVEVALGESSWWPFQQAFGALCVVGLAALACVTDLLQS